MITLLNINKSYGNKKVISNFSLTINDKDFIAITGKSGCGKSTLLNIIGLLERCDSGCISILGYNNLKPKTIQATKLLRNEISYLFQNYALIDEETVFYNLNLALKYSKGKNKAIISNALSKVGLSGFEKKEFIN